MVSVIYVPISATAMLRVAVVSVKLAGHGLVMRSALVIQQRRLKTSYETDDLYPMDVYTLCYIDQPWVRMRERFLSSAVGTKLRFQGNIYIVS